MEPVEVVMAHYEAMSRGDVEAAMRNFAADVRWTEAAGWPYPGTSVGREEVLANVFGQISRDWEKFAAIPSEPVAQGDTVVVLGTYRGTHRVTGRAFDARFAHVWRVRGGEVVEMEQIADSARALAVMGQ
ncbi:nuclear transport factor 2 family protein [Georgenia sp. H159]|uniref:nuclear transport factor 2 family protein n=1 Tax=Georgenia sp. H159 TaxID=3076115 RepID=UPI002D790D87|nr:nuclear transport factor 2 family protein [Georgenia sp. H159]